VCVGRSVTFDGRADITAVMHATETIQTIRNTHATGVTASTGAAHSDGAAAGYTAASSRSAASSRTARFTADTIARSEEVEISASMPTPHRIRPFTFNST